MTDIKDTPLKTRGTVYFDADCALCTGLLERFGAIFRYRGFVFRPLKEGMAADCAPFPAEDFQREMKLQTQDGRWFGGADACFYLAATIAWLRPIMWLGHLPGVRPLAHLLYRKIAANRSCANGSCEVNKTPALDRWLPLIVLPAGALMLGPSLAGWVWMWLLAFAIFAGCKWLTFRDAIHGRKNPGWRRALAYLLFWPGMDGTAFLFGTAKRPPKAIHWAAALAKTLAGIGLLCLLVPRLPGDCPLLTGWTAMTGVVLILHFGLFHLLALFWQTVGYEARPLMRAPLLAKGLADFWGRRWNLAFHQLTARYLYHPLRCRVGPTRALLLAFLISGLVHELVITVPAGGGYGLPTLFFVLQGLGCLAERNPIIRRHPARMRIIGWCLLLPPAVFLFPPIFIHHIILPMLTAMGLQ